MKNISGYVENITFRNEDNGYTVLTLLSGKKEIKCTGTFGYIGEGEYVEIEGEEVFHDIYGDNTNTFVEEKVSTPVSGVSRGSSVAKPKSQVVTLSSVSTTDEERTKTGIKVSGLRSY